MKLKETTLDQRLFAGLICIIALVYGFLVVGAIDGKFEQICRVPDAGHLETTMLRVYVLLGTVGCGLGTLHLLSMWKFKK